MLTWMDEPRDAVACPQHSRFKAILEVEAMEVGMWILLVWVRTRHGGVDETLMKVPLRSAISIGMASNGKGARR